MKKSVIVLLVLLLAMLLAGCQGWLLPGEPAVNQPAETAPEVTVPETEPEPQPTLPAIALENGRFPAGTVLFGVELGGMNEEEAFAAIEGRVAIYFLRLTVNGKTVPLTGEALGLTASREKFHTFFTSLNGQENPENPGIFTYNENNLTRLVQEAFNVSARDACLVYSPASGQFESIAEAVGTTIIPGPALTAADRAITNLISIAQAEVQVVDDLPGVVEESVAMEAARNKANEYLKIVLHYTFTPNNGISQREVLTKEIIASFITFDSTLTPQVSREAIAEYADQMNAKYQVPGEVSSFVTTDGAVIDLEVANPGQLVDVEALTDDIYDCLTNNVIGTRAAVYKGKTQLDDADFNSSYVEVSMSQQHLWVYKNGVCVVDTPVVTGCANYNWNTPRGVYEINRKGRNVKLIGADYVSFVQYWLPFIGGAYGLHDANWRSEFGGDIYLYDGSHGCINMPRSITSQVYDNVEVGTKVVIYGGATNSEPLEQRFNGATTFSSAADKAFLLDVLPEYPVKDITYSVADTSVLEVAADGTVTPKKVGTTTVTVTSPQKQFYTEASITVTVNITDPCLEGRHTASTWTTVKAPDCGIPGVAKGICDRCGAETRKELSANGQHIHIQKVTTEATCLTPGWEIVKCLQCKQELSRTELGLATGHSFQADKAECLNGCGTQNPDYLPAPTEPSQEEAAG